MEGVPPAGGEGGHPPNPFLLSQRDALGIAKFQHFEEQFSHRKKLSLLKLTVLTVASGEYPRKARGRDFYYQAETPTAVIKFHKMNPLSKVPLIVPMLRESGCRQRRQTGEGVFPRTPSVVIKFQHFEEQFSHRKKLSLLKLTVLTAASGEYPRKARGRDSIAKLKPAGL